MIRSFLCSLCAALRARSALSVAVFGAVWLGNGPARAADEEGLALRVDIVAHECAEDEQATRAAFASEVEARLRRSVVVKDEAPAVLALSLTRGQDDRVVGRATFRGIAGRDERVVKGKSCAEVVQAIAFIATTWLESEPEHAHREVARDMRVPPPAPAPVLEMRTSPPASIRMAWRTGIALGVVRRPALDVAVSVGYAPRSDRYELRAGLRLARASGSDLAERYYFWATIPFDGCKNLSLSIPRTRESIFGPLTVGLCGRLEPGVFYAVVSHTSGVDAKHLLGWFGLGPGLRLGSAIGKVRIEIEGFALVPITGYRISGDQATFEGVRTVVASVGLGVMLPIW